MVFFCFFSATGTNCTMLVFIQIGTFGVSVDMLFTNHLIYNVVNIVNRRLGSICATGITNDLHGHGHIHQLIRKEFLLFIGKPSLYRPVKQINKVLTGQVQFAEFVGYIFSGFRIFCHLSAGNHTQTDITAIVGIDQHCLFFGVQHRLPQAGITGGIPLCITQLHRHTVLGFGIADLSIAQAGFSVRDSQIACQEDQRIIILLRQLLNLGAATDGTSKGLLAFLFGGRLHSNNTGIPLVVFLYSLTTAGTGNTVLIFIYISAICIAVCMFFANDLVADTIDIVNRRLGSICTTGITDDLHRYGHIHQLI